MLKKCICIADWWTSPSIVLIRKYADNICRNVWKRCFDAMMSWMNKHHAKITRSQTSKQPQFIGDSSNRCIWCWIWAAAKQWPVPYKYPKSSSKWQWSLTIAYYIQHSFLFIPFRTSTFGCAFKVALSFWTRNFYKCLINITDLPYILCATASLHVQSIRRFVYKSAN